MADESYVAVSPDSTGKQIRNLHIVERTQDTAGVETLNDRYMQVVSISDDQGQVLDFDQSAVRELLTDVRTELRILNMNLLALIDGKSSVVDPVMARESRDFV